MKRNVTIALLIGLTSGWSLCWFSLGRIHAGPSIVVPQLIFDAAGNIFAVRCLDLNGVSLSSVSIVERELVDRKIHLKWSGGSEPDYARGFVTTIDFEVPAEKLGAYPGDVIKFYNNIPIYQGLGPGGGNNNEKIQPITP